MLSKQQRNAGVVFMILGIYVIYYTLTELEIGSIHDPGSGFFTMICGAGILLCASILVISGFVRGTENRPLWEPGQWKKPALSYVIILAYALLIPHLGFLIATAAFLLAWQILIEHEKPVKMAIIVVLGTVSMWVLFEQLLKVPLPNGILPW